MAIYDDSMITLDIERQYQCDSAMNTVPDDTNLQRWIAVAYQPDSVSSGGRKDPATDIKIEAALLIVDEATMRDFNRDYRNIDKSTNVLSFPANLAVIDGVKHLGDIIACAPVINSEAGQQAKSIDAHWAHMMIHGMLHLQNYDHHNDTDASIMETLEINLLQQLGFVNPYTATH